MALLELELADLRWGRHYARRITPIKDWLRTLNHEALWRKMEPFCAGSLNEVDSGIEINKELEIQWKRKDAAARKAKSRKKLGKKV